MAQTSTSDDQREGGLALIARGLEALAGEDLDVRDPASLGADLAVMAQAVSRVQAEHARRPDHTHRDRRPTPCRGRPRPPLPLPGL